MPVAVVFLDAGLLTINGTLLAEIVAFLLMLGVLARWVYPPIIRAAEARQKQIQEQLDQAEKARHEAERRLQEAADQLDQARVEAQRIIEAARRSAEQVAQQVRDRAEAEAKRILEQARQDIEAERQRAAYVLREQMADLVVAATQKVIGEMLTVDRHRKLIERAIEEVSAVAAGEPSVQA